MEDFERQGVAGFETEAKVGVRNGIQRWRGFATDYGEIVAAETELANVWPVAPADNFAGSEQDELSGRPARGRSDRF